jgi:isopentenyldiphosphate isomerase
VQQNDPRELLEVFDSAGQPTGRAKTRAAIHLDGDWHVAFHCWILRNNGREVVLQRRSLLKDTFAGLWDASAAGHWRFGESAAQASREIAEELGLAVAFDQLRYRGQERSARQFDNGLTDRELHRVYLLHDDRALLDYRPDPAEVIGVAAFDWRTLVELTLDRVQSLRAIEAVRVNPDASLSTDEVVLTREAMVPYSAARLRRMLRSSRTD